MNSREKILNAVKGNQPTLQPLPDLNTVQAIQYSDVTVQFSTVLSNIGGKAIEITHEDDVTDYIKNHFPAGSKLITTMSAFSTIPLLKTNIDPHQLADIDIAILPAQFGVAENGAVWLTDEEFGTRALPFICQHLIVVLQKNAIVTHMHDAYKKIANHQYKFGVFIAGPSKTADIEQSLVLGAHGPKSMTVFILS